MPGFDDKKKPKRYSDLATVNSSRNDLTAEEFPEGPYGSSLPTYALGKSSPWREDQHANSPYGYENIELHRGMPREYAPEDTEAGITEDVSDPQNAES